MGCDRGERGEEMLGWMKEVMEFVWWGMDRGL